MTSPNTLNLKSDCLWKGGATIPDVDDNDYGGRGWRCYFSTRGNRFLNGPVLWSGRAQNLLWWWRWSTSLSSVMKATCSYWNVMVPESWTFISFHLAVINSNSSTWSIGGRPCRKHFLRECRKPLIVSSPSLGSFTESERVRGSLGSIMSSPEVTSMSPPHFQVSSASPFAKPYFSDTGFLLWLAFHVNHIRRKPWMGFSLTRPPF